MNIRDIAAAANVSASTVSKVLNKKDHDISEATKQRVLSIIKEYNYNPYSKVKELNNSKSSIIALIVQASLISKDLISQIEQPLAKQGYSLLICTLETDSTSLSKHLNILRAKNVDGILLYVNDPSFIKSFESENTTTIPSIYIHYKEIPNHATIQCSPADTAFCATNLLIKHGHTQIGCILGADEPIEETLAKEGYLRALFEASIPRNEVLIFPTHASNTTGLRSNLERLINQEITAIYCQSSVLTALLYAYLQDAGLKIPNDISIICGETTTLTQNLNPTTTSIEIPLSKLGHLAASSIINKAENTSSKLERAEKIEPIIHKGDSLGLPSLHRTKIVAIGNISVDIMIPTEHIPIAGELLSTSNIINSPGGKGINQAIGASKLGGSVFILGRLGDDLEGHTVIDSLSNANVKTEGLIIDSASSTGKSFVIIPENDNSTVISYSGANALFNVKQLNRSAHIFTISDYCLLSTELPPEIIEKSIEFCINAKTKIILKPSTMGRISKKMLKNIDYLVPNRDELDQIIPGNESIEEKADKLYSICRTNIIITLGKDGCFLKNANYSLHFPAASFTPVDTTGAANCFISALAVSLGEGNSLIYAICFATYAAGLSIIQPGIQSSFPTRTQLDIYLDEINHMYSEIVSVK